MVPIDTDDAPHIPPPAANGTSAPPPVKAHKGVYGRASDFLSNTSNWKVRRGL
jgi:homocitrate synthase